MGAVAKGISVVQSPNTGAVGKPVAPLGENGALKDTARLCEIGRDSVGMKSDTQGLSAKGWSCRGKRKPKQS